METNKVNTYKEGLAENTAGEVSPTYGATAQTVTTANAPGSANTISRSDHAHFHGNLLGGLLHALATQSIAGFMSSTDKLKLDAATLTGMLFGNGSEFSENAVTAQTNSGVYVQYHSFTTQSLAAGDYLILWMIEWGRSNANGRSSIRVQVDNTTDLIDITLDTSDTNARQLLTGFKAITLTASTHTIDVDYLSSNSNFSIIDNAYLMIFRVG